MGGNWLEERYATTLSGSFVFSATLEELAIAHQPQQAVHDHDQAPVAQE
jgi:hypothetical protein